MPVATGSDTLSRVITPGATFSIGYALPAFIAPAPSIGAPSAFTTRPKIASETGTSRILPVALTSSPSLIFEKSPRIITPTVSSSRLSATPASPPAKVTISEDLISERPETLAMPSKTSTTLPTFSALVSILKFSISFLKLSTMWFDIFIILLLCLH